MAGEHMDERSYCVRIPWLSGFVKRSDGAFLAVNRNERYELEGAISRDGGRSWGEQYPIVTASGKPTERARGTSIIRLHSGRIALHYGQFEGDVEKKPGGQANHDNEYIELCCTSDDEGKTWSEPCALNHPAARGSPMYDVMLQTSSGRLILPVRACYAGRLSEKEASRIQGTAAGHPVGTGSEGQYPQMDIAYVYYSDDEGRTWRRSANHVLVWPENGKLGVYPLDEPTVAQATDGRLVMIGRSTLGRVVESWSDDDGVTWTRALPNALCNSYSPARVRAIPSTGDLHCVWNQVTRDEIRRGFRRSRLTSAISKDCGKTWEHFTTLDVADPLDKSPYQAPGPEIGYVGSEEGYVGELPANYCIYRYADMRYEDDMAYIIYRRNGFSRPGGARARFVLRAMPIEWLYDDTRTDLSLPNDVAEAPGGVVSEDIEA